ncbi:hypothetical protein BDA96_01G251400 [Sorghum bicolor]|uniref:Uncharacterized protein n=2 Tax=Sorghum bicolor TaxID=4558 RepID=A0A921UZ93_SORBI|nr:hypothetical protein BDA96_01G251400 [Sorghum bicolor]KXG38455.1 hypothetical protein SORBI_3001G236700 [Sorghum bicolor]
MAWLDPVNLPSGKSSCCSFCGEPLQFVLQSPSVTPRKPLQSDNTSHSQEEDSYSVTLASFSNMDQVEFSSGSYWGTSSDCLKSNSWVFLSSQIW